MTVSGDDHEIDHNTFQNKNTEGQMLEVQGPRGRAMAQRTWIHHNYFYNFENSRRNNSSALHIGHSSRSLSAAHSVVEHNLFIKTRGENEGASAISLATISIDSIRSERAAPSYLCAMEIVAWFTATSLSALGAGCDSIGDDHRIFSNYFQDNRPAVQIGNGGANVPPAELTSHDRPDRVQFVFNTLIDNRSNVIMRNRRSGLGATHLIIANNIIQGGRNAASIEGPLPDATWQGNIIWGIEDEVGDIPPAGYTSIDPQLQKGTGGIYRLGSGQSGHWSSHRFVPLCHGRHRWACARRQPRRRCSAVFDLVAFKSSTHGS